MDDASPRLSDDDYADDGMAAGIDASLRSRSEGCDAALDASSSRRSSSVKSDLRLLGRMTHAFDFSAWDDFRTSLPREERRLIVRASLKSLSSVKSLEGREGGEGGDSASTLLVPFPSRRRVTLEDGEVEEEGEEGDSSSWGRGEDARWSIGSTSAVVGPGIGPAANGTREGRASLLASIGMDDLDRQISELEAETLLSLSRASSLVMTGEEGRALNSNIESFGESALFSVREGSREGSEEFSEAEGRGASSSSSPGRSFRTSAASLGAAGGGPGLPSVDERAEGSNGTTTINEKGTEAAGSVVWADEQPWAGEQPWWAAANEATRKEEEAESARGFYEAFSGTETDAADGPEDAAALSDEERYDNSLWRLRLLDGAVFEEGYVPQEWERKEMEAIVEFLGLRPGAATRRASWKDPSVSVSIIFFRYNISTAARDGGGNPLVGLIDPSLGCFFVASPCLFPLREIENYPARMASPKHGGTLTRGRDRDGESPLGPLLTYLNNVGNEQRDATCTTKAHLKYRWD